MLLFVAHVSGHSMQPAFLENDQLLVSNIPYWFSNPKVGDVVAFVQDQKINIKRIGNINNSLFFVVGDNSEDSLDSRKLGWIERRTIVGKVLLKI